VQGDEVAVTGRGNYWWAPDDIFNAADEMSCNVGNVQFRCLSEDTEIGIPGGGALGQGGKQLW
jgi:hypothetical protein